MSDPLHQYQELIQQTKRLLLESYAEDAWLLTDSESYAYFRQRAAAQTVARPAVPKPTTTLKPYVPPAPAQTSAPVVPRATPKPVQKASPPPPPEPPSKQQEAPETPRAPRLTPLSPAPADSLEDWRPILQKVAPRLQLLEGPPKCAVPDRSALDRAEVWITVTPQLSAVEMRLVQDIARALSQHGHPACVVPLDIAAIQQSRPKHLVCVGPQLATPTLHIESVEALLNSPEAKKALWSQLLTTGLGYDEST